MRNLHASVDESDLIKGLDFWGKTSVNTENFALDDSANTKIVEDFSAISPGVGVSILSDGLIVETIDCGDLSGLVVASQEGDMSGVLKF